MDKPSPTPRSQHAFQAPKGTRDFYPAEQARRRFIYDAWRRVSLRHGFDEISGPTFEHLDLYTVKSGDEIVSELFSFTRAGGKRQFALRPEFTPTLARMVAARAKTLPKPIRWFSVENYFRAERPQRGRLREFAQWNIDILGTQQDVVESDVDVEIISVLVDLFLELGLGPDDVRIRFGHRGAIEKRLLDYGVPKTNLEAALLCLDKSRDKNFAAFEKEARQLGFTDEAIKNYNPEERLVIRIDIDPDDLEDPDSTIPRKTREELRNARESPGTLINLLHKRKLQQWCDWDSSIVRGLAYYTDLVFEVHETGGKERAIAGGGRYDKLVELFGGPPTPAVGFAMGDVVLANVLKERGLIPQGAALLEKIGARPDVFVIATDEQAVSQLAPALAALRRAGLHARRSYKATRNVGKLLKEASAAGARLAIILESEQAAQIKSLDTGEQSPSSADPDALVETVKRLLQGADGEP